MIIQVHISAETEARLRYAQKNHDMVAGASLEWLAEALIEEGALNYARNIDPDPAEAERRSKP